jgi:hypothetical protein
MSISAFDPQATSDLVNILGAVPAISPSPPDRKVLGFG